MIDTFGDADVLHIAELPLAQPSHGQVQIRVSAIAVNPVDLTTRAGLNIAESDARFPMLLGWDVAGTVVAIGARVTAWKAGDRVAAMVFQPVDQHGVYAAHVTLDAELLARLPDDLDFPQADTVPLAGLTASQLLDEALTEGARSLLVDGPLGAVGRSIVALAVRGGVDVIGVVRPEQTDELLALGAAHAVHRGDFTAAVHAQYQDGVDAAVDLVGGATARATIAAVRDGGRYATAVPSYIDPSGPFETERGISVHMHTVRPDTARLGVLLALAAGNALPARIEQAFPLDEAAEAHRRQAAGGLTGRVLLIP